MFDNASTDSQPSGLVCVSGQSEVTGLLKLIGGSACLQQE